MIKNKFSSDGCTSVPELIFHKSCVKHDCDYHNHIGRLKADKRFLKNMLNSIKEHKELNCEEIMFYTTAAKAYFLGVRLFGWWFYYVKK